MPPNNSSLMRIITLPISVVFALQTWRHYLYGVPCRINTDHQSLKYIFSQKKLSLHETSVVADQMQIKKEKYCGRCRKKEDTTYLEHCSKYSTESLERAWGLAHSISVAQECECSIASTYLTPLPNGGTKSE